MNPLAAETQAQPPQPSPAPQDTELSRSRQAFLALLERVCEHFKVPAPQRQEVVASQALMIGDALVALDLEEWSSFVKVFVEVGRPVDADAPKLHRYLLTQHLQQAAPFFLTAGVHPESEQVFLYGYSPLPDDAQADTAFFGFVQGCVFSRDVLRSEVPVEYTPHQ